MKTLPRIKISGDLQTLIQDKLEQGTSEAVFAAAPALLEALKRMLGEFDRPSNDSSVTRSEEIACNYARTAIAQAERGPTMRDVSPAFAKMQDDCRAALAKSQSQ